MQQRLTQLYCSVVWRSQNVVQPRLFVLGKYFVWFLKKTLFGGLAVTKAAHLYDLRALAYVPPRSSRKQNADAKNSGTRGKEEREGSTGRSGSVGRALMASVANTVHSATGRRPSAPPGAAAAAAAAAAAGVGDGSEDTTAALAPASSTQQSQQPLQLLFKDFRVLLENPDACLGRLAEAHHEAARRTVGAALERPPPADGLELMHRIYGICVLKVIALAVAAAVVVLSYS